MRLLEHAYEYVVLAVGILIYGLALIPAYALVIWGHRLGFPWVVLTYPAAFYLFIFCLILVAGAIKTVFVPRLKPGQYNFATDKHVNTWFVSRSITEFVLTPFNRIIFTNDIFRYVCLRLFGVKLHYSSVISSSFISDLDLLSFGKNCVIGGWAIVYGHVEPEPGALILAPTSVGDNSLIGARASMACGSQVGNETVIGFNVTIGIQSRVGHKCNVGMNTLIAHHSVIGDNVRIGKCSSIGTRVKISSGLKLPDNSIVPDFTTVDSQDMANSFRTLRVSEVENPRQPDPSAPMSSKSKKPQA